MTIRVLHIGKYFPPHRGGMETFLRDLAVEQKKQKLHVRLLVHASKVTLFSKCDDQEEQGQHLRITRTARWFNFSFAPVSPTFLFQLSRAIRVERPDILHIHMPNASALWCLVSPEARKIPWVVHWHSDVINSSSSFVLEWLYRLYRPIEKAILNLASAIIATSTPYLETSEPLQEHVSKCSVVPLGIQSVPPRFDHSRVSSGLQPLNRAESPFRVLFVGRLTYYKGLEFLIEAINNCPGVELTVIGCGDREHRLKKLVDALALSNRVKLVGELDDEGRSAALMNSDCLCLPSIERTEAFGVVLLEAMRASRATVVTDVEGSGMSWVVEDPGTGVVAPASDSEGLALAIRQLAKDRQACIVMGRNGYKRFLEHYQIARVSTIINTIYCDLTS